MLSILLIPGKHLKRQEMMLQRELRGEEYEIINAPSWSDGLEVAKGEYVCFMEPEARVSDSFFHDLLDVFLEQPSFRKLAFVAPSVSKPSWLSTKRVYGYKISKSTIIPSFSKSSISPYSIQIGYLPGAIMRKSILPNLDDIEKDPIMGSVRLCLNFWSNGLRCLVDPRAVYTVTTTPIELGIFIQDGLPEDIEELVNMFERESI